MDHGTGDRFPYFAARQLVGWAASCWGELQAAHGWHGGLEAMPARLAFSWFFERLLDGRSDYARLDILTKLGDAEALHEMNEQEMATLVAAGGEIG